MMPPICWAQPQGRPLRLLCLGAHCDDIEIGCGGAVLRLIETFAEVACDWVVLSSNRERREEAMRSAAAFLDGVPESRRTIAVESFRESYFPWAGAEIKDYFQDRLAGLPRPDLIFTHFRDDRHQDHRIVSDLTWNAFRDHMILEYEIPKWDGDLATPNLYVALGEAIVERKVQLLLEHFPSQRSRRWFDADTFKGLMRLRGVESNAPERFAEAFHCRKAVL
jgi:LmbE family N-acetylglucosaminyl deacetylase